MMQSLLNVDVLSLERICCNFFLKNVKSGAETNWTTGGFVR